MMFRVRRDEFWALDPSVCFLNHGSFGACPRPVLQRQAELRARLEAEPVRFMKRELEPALDAARIALARFLGARPEHLAPVTNATTGVNAVVRSLRFTADDEILTTSHLYNACHNVLRRSGARIVVVDLPLPLTGASQIVERVLGAVTPKTRLLLLDHVTSPTGLVFPVDVIVPECERRGVMVLVDGAHAPGMLPLSLDALGASFYTGNLHKWVCTPKSAAFLHVRPDRQALIQPCVTSHGANSPRTDRSRFQLEFDWVGTTDLTPFLCVPEALAAMASLHDGGWPELMDANHHDALAAREQLQRVLGVPPIAPPELVGAMAAVSLGAPGEGLQDRLFFEAGIEVPVIPFDGAWLVRVSCQRHVRPGDVERLAQTLVDFTREGRVRGSVG